MPDESYYSSPDNISSIRTIRTQLMVRWHITSFCNYHCPYCAQKYSMKSTMPSESECLRIEDNLIKTLADYAHEFRVRIIGGELSCLPYMDKVIDRLSVCRGLKRLDITTNLSQSAGYYTELYRICRDKGIPFIANASLHETECREDDFFSKVLEMKEFAKVSFVLTDSNLGTGIRVVNFCRVNGIPFAVEPVRDHHSNILLESQDAKDFYSSLEPRKKAVIVSVAYKDGTVRNMTGPVLRYVLHGGIQCNPMYCLCGISKINVDSDGTVLRSSCRKRSVIGSLSASPVSLSDVGIIECRLKEGDKCSCCEGINIFRQRSEAEACARLYRESGLIEK